MDGQRYYPYQNSFCSINNVLENFAYGSSINHYRSHLKNQITPVYEEVESDSSDHYTEIRKLFDENLNYSMKILPLKMKDTKNKVRIFRKLKQIQLSSMKNSS